MLKMYKKNNSLVAVFPDARGTWTFCLPSTSSTVSEQAEQMISIFEKSYDILEEIMNPEKTSVYTTKFPAETPIEETFVENVDIDQMENLTYTFAGPIDGLRTLLMQETDKRQGFDFLIGRIQFERATVNCRLADGDVYVNRDQHSVYYYNGEVNENKSGVSDPLDFEVVYFDSINIPDIESESIICVRIRTWTDIWFEDTEIGAVNRDRLRSTLERLDEELPIKKFGAIVNSPSLIWRWCTKYSISHQTRN